MRESGRDRHVSGGDQGADRQELSGGLDGFCGDRGGGRGTAAGCGRGDPGAHPGGRCLLGPGAAAGDGPDRRRLRQCGHRRLYVPSGGVRTRRIAGACLDVYEQEPLPPDSPLRDLPNVLLTPHTAGLPDGVRFYAGRYRFSLWITSGTSWPARSQSTRSTMFLSGGGPDKTAAYRRQKQGEGPFKVPPPRFVSDHRPRERLSIPAFGPQAPPGAVRRHSAGDSGRTGPPPARRYSQGSCCRRHGA